MKTFVFFAFLSLGLLANNVVAEDLPSKARKTWRWENDGECISVDLSGLNSSGEGMVVACDVEGEDEDPTCDGHQINDFQTYDQAEDGTFYCFDIVFDGDDVHFNINPDTDTGRVLGGPCSAPTGDLQTFTEGNSCAGAFQTLMTVGLFGTISAFLFSAANARTFSQ